jgi:hypothetical protein
VQQPIEGLVRDLRRVVDVVQLFVAADVGAKRLEAIEDGGDSHGALRSRAI